MLGPGGRALAHHHFLAALRRAVGRVDDAREVQAVFAGHLQGRVPRGSYVEQRMLNPATIGAPIVKITPKFDYSLKSGATALREGVKNGVWSPEVTVEL